MKNDVPPTVTITRPTPIRSRHRCKSHDLLLSKFFSSILDDLQDVSDFVRVQVILMLGVTGGGDKV
jgi:hypothetical protein